MEITEAMLTELKLTDEQKNKLVEYAKADDEAVKGATKTLNERITKLESDITNRDKELQALTKNKGNAEELQQKLAELKANSEKKIAEYEEELKKEKIHNAVKLKLTTLAKDVDVVSRFIDVDKLIISDDGKVIGVDEQVNTLKEKYGYMFNDEPTTNTGTANYTPNGGNNAGANNPFAKETFNLTEQGRLLTENPEYAKQLASAAGVKL